MLWLLSALAASTALVADDPIDSALALAGLAPQTARFDKNILRFFDFDEFVLGSFDAYWEAPWRIPGFEQAVRGSVELGAAKPSELVMSGGRLVGLGVRRTLLGDPNEQLKKSVKANPNLAGALAAVASLAGQGDALKALEGVERVPKQVAEAATLILRASLPVFRARELSFGGNPEEAWGELVTPEGEAFANVDAELRVARKTDLRYMTSAATDLVLACEDALAILASSPVEAFSFDVETPLGWVVLNGSASDQYDDRPYLLIIDTGGNDTYLGGGATSSARNGVSILLDLGGDDSYLGGGASKERAVAQSDGRRTAGAVPGHGGALCGVAVLFDAAGNDLYRSLAPAQGSARYGLAVHWDRAGNDVYDAYKASQGFGSWGIGILLDTAGDDGHDCFTQSQGCGLTTGFGLLADVAGNDRYNANDTVLDFPSSQSKEHNTSMAQGSGFGRRADYSDGHSLGGGFGVLCDLEGDDAYSCGVFGQGVGYWKAVGLLIDKAGNDKYAGAWYVQAAAAHFAVGVLHDCAGDDSYAATMNMAQGAGHDFSIGFLLDDAGNDAHAAPNLSLGGGNANGIGIFIDRGGNDTYASRGTTLGKANAAAGVIRSIALCLGVFLDLGGDDTYPDEADWAKNGTEAVNWRGKKDKPEESQVGVFVDKQ
jgi:hypothetical protein